MCGIFGAFDRNEFVSLARANSYRGQHSFSIVTFDQDLSTIKGIQQRLGVFDESLVSEEGYKIGHIQAPTGNNGVDSIHPAKLGDVLLWHNGLIKDFDCERLRKKQNSNETWDTRLLLNEVVHKNRFANLSEINGSFACVMFENTSLFVFRNAISPLFFGEDRLSSVKTELTPESLPAEKFFLVNMVEKKLSFFNLGSFTTKENPYFGL
jgi:glutamine phosphoribosylpyrophosphate amidotransferase